MNETISIGRAPDNHIVLNFPQVSGYHARFTRDGNGFIIEDLQSSNGTFVNGQRITRAVVGFADKVHFGSLPFSMDNLKGEILSRITGKRPSFATPAPTFVPSPQTSISGQSLFIGRNPDCDIILDFPQVSGRHVKLTRMGTGFQVEDLQSTNGTFVGGQRIASAFVSQGDSIYLGSFKFNLSQLESAKKRTVFMKTSDIVKPSEKIKILKDTMSIGREQDNDIVLAFPQVSAHHALLKKVEGGYLIEDLNSSNGTFVNGTRIKSAFIRDSDQIQFGSIVLELEKGEIARHDQSRSVRLDVVEAMKQDGNKIYLNKVSLSIFPNEFVGLLGPSGAGKSTLLDTIIGIRKATSGQVYVNNANLYENFDSFRRWIGYVPQDDIIHKELTVRQCLYYTAKLRLALDEAGINKRIDEVLEELELTPIQDKQIGGSKEKISGGQRKRVSLGVELLAEPGLLFLDEPTSGLDPRVERVMMQLFRKLADQGRTIVVTTHSMESLDQLDNIVFLSEGGTLAYYGPAKEAAIFFGSEKASEVFEKLKKQDAPVRDREYKNSPYFKNYVDRRLADLVPHKAEPQKQLKVATDKIIDLRQAGILFRRNINIKIKDKMNTLLLLSQAPVIAFFMTLGFKKPDMQLSLMMCISALFFGCINSCREIVGELSIYRRERMVNLSIPSYILSKVGVLSSFCLLQSIMFLAIVNPCLDLQSNVVKTFSVFFLTAMGGLALGLFISALVDTNEKAMSLVPLVLLPQILFTGAIFQLKGITENISYFTISRWSFEAFLELEGFSDVATRQGLKGNNLDFDIGFMALIAIVLIFLTGFWLKKNDIK